MELRSGFKWMAMHCSGRWRSSQCGHILSPLPYQPLLGVFGVAVRAVVVRVNSPGGSALASDSIRRELQRLKTLGKTVVVRCVGMSCGHIDLHKACPHNLPQTPSTQHGRRGGWRGLLHRVGCKRGSGAAGHRHRRHRGGGEQDRHGARVTCVQAGRQGARVGRRAIREIPLLYATA